MNRRSLLCGALALAACAAAETPAPAPFPMRRGVNLGNALEAPSEGEWGYAIAPAHLEAILEAGFDGVRVPVRWDQRAAPAPPYAIDPAHLDRVAEVAETALALGLKVQLDVHHYEALNADPDREEARFAALWRQIAARFEGQEAGLLFEPLNEPNGPAMTPARVSRLQAAALAAIRPAHPARLVVLGPPNWNSIDGLAGWRPPADPHTAVTVHYYEPHAFTHENAEWMGADAPRFGRAWGAPADRAALARHAAQAAAWARAQGLALQLGEFGVNRRVAPAQRALWTRAVREAFEAEGAAWCYWDFAGAFSLWDAQTRRFDEALLAALHG